MSQLIGDLLQVTRVEGDPVCATTSDRDRRILREIVEDCSLEAMGELQILMHDDGERSSAAIASCCAAPSKTCCAMPSATPRPGSRSRCG